ncbi:hypothetical protein [Actinoplanes friuliensis]|jgi:hypothetical protein|uniref:Sulfotransferase family protein n=1 Tax=Actinoplanes friuliensis DSM 7358 TaxID=1246995 RepID=U5VXI2_9ACTN|nr:hypothetical protein [Actinoplanes friuliensis]AGZ41507.1 hypothetical protein AFR_16125 [Actinoplanes friuliensis DSM 7358]
MARRVFVHIGAPKTGSTYVQNVLWSNRKALKGAGLLLPGSPSAQDQAMTDLRQVSWRDADATWTWDRLAAEAAAWSGDVVISNEALGGATDAQAARAVESLRPAEVHIVVAGRDLWRTFPSMWQQGIRARNVGSFESFLRSVEQGKFDTFWELHTANRMLRRWGDLVPATQRHLVTVPPPGTPHETLWLRFAGILGIPEGLCELTAPAANPSLGAAEIEVLRRVNAALGDRYPHRTPYQRVVQRHLVDAVLKQAPNKLRFGVGLDRADWVAEQAEQQIKELADYPCEIAGDLDELRPAAMAATFSPDDLDEKQVLDAAIETIIGMLAHADSRTEPPQPTRTLSRLKRRLLR